MRIKDFGLFLPKSASVFSVGKSFNFVGINIPVVESPSEPASLVSRWPGACESAYLEMSVKL